MSWQPGDNPFAPQEGESSGPASTPPPAAPRPGAQNPFGGGHPGGDPFPGQQAGPNQFPGSNQFPGPNQHSGQARFPGQSSGAPFGQQNQSYQPNPSYQPNQPYQPNQSYQPGPGSLPLTSRPTRNSKSVVIGLVATMVVVLGLVLVLVGFLGRNPAQVTAPEPRPAPTAPASPDPTTSPTPTPTPLRTPSQLPPSGPYLQSPKLVDNPIYQVRFDQWSCAMDPTVPSARADKERWVNQTIDCMMSRYEPAVRQAGGTLPRPTLSFFENNQIKTPCDQPSGRIPAYYCSADQKIYVGLDVLERYDDNVRLGAMSLLFHEFAHHVQNRVGFFTAFDPKRENSQQLQRRIELQAECFTWVQLSSLKDFSADDERQLRHWAQQGGDALHGDKNSYVFWFERALGQPGVGVCNTWSAPTDKVS